MGKIAGWVGGSEFKSSYTVNSGVAKVKLLGMLWAKTFASENMRKARFRARLNFFALEERIFIFWGGVSNSGALGGTFDEGHSTDVSPRRTLK